jgi:hypothetical protein
MEQADRNANGIFPAVQKFKFAETFFTTRRPTNQIALKRPRNLCAAVFIRAEFARNDLTICWIFLN